MLNEDLIMTSKQMVFIAIAQPIVRLIQNNDKNYLMMPLEFTLK